MTYLGTSHAADTVVDVAPCVTSAHARDLPAEFLRKLKRRNKKDASTSPEIVEEKLPSSPEPELFFPMDGFDEPIAEVTQPIQQNTQISPPSISRSPITEFLKPKGRMRSGSPSFPRSSPLSKSNSSPDWFKGESPLEPLPNKEPISEPDIFDDFNPLG